MFSWFISVFWVLWDRFVVEVLCVSCCVVLVMVLSIFVFMGFDNCVGLVVCS